MFPKLHRKTFVVSFQFTIRKKIVVSLKTISIMLVANDNKIQFPESFFV